jgi:phenol hydroxylase P0 protein
MSQVTSIHANRAVSENSADPLRNLTKYVRVTSEPDEPFVSFDFAIGDPELFVELVMPPKVFEFFCEKNSCVPMTDEQSAEIDAQIAKWRYGEDTLMAKNHNNTSAKQ